MRSMTGFGSATTRRGGYIVTSEIKTVNNRYLKTAYRISDGFSSLETKIESLLRGKIERGTVNVSLRLRREAARNNYSIDGDAVNEYFDQITKLRNGFRFGELPMGSLSDLLRLPGVIQEKDAPDESEETDEELWPIVEANLNEALAALNKMRDAEGASMEANLRALCENLTEKISEVERFAPSVAESYRGKLIERIGKIMGEHGVELNPADLVREVALFTDKADISEETVRFRSHLAQFDSAMSVSASGCGKRLDFLTQEMFREVNTVGSKANASAITNGVVEMKTTIEKIREMVQNVE